MQCLHVLNLWLGPAQLCLLIRGVNLNCLIMNKKVVTLNRECFITRFIFNYFLERYHYDNVHKNK